jgi:hypothetical protein
MELTRLVNDSLWDVGAFDGKVVGSPHPVPWHFRADGTMEAANIWVGKWRKIKGEEHRIHCEITTGGGDKWDVVFVNDDWFVGYKGGRLYRLGKKR